MGNIDYDYLSSSTASAENAAGNFVLSQSLVSILIIIIGAIAVISLVLGVVSLVMNIKNSGRLDNISNKLMSIQSPEKDGIGVVFCKNCGNQYSVSQKQCPYCGSKR